MVAGVDEERRRCEFFVASPSHTQHTYTCMHERKRREREGEKERGEKERLTSEEGGEKETPAWGDRSLAGVS